MPATTVFLPPTYPLTQAPVFDMGLLIGATGATTTQTSADVNTFAFKGITVILNMSTVGTGSVGVQIQGKDFSNSGSYFTLLASGAITANGCTAHTLYPGINQPSSQPANGNSSVSMILPQWIRIQVVANNANATSYTVGAVLTT